MKFTLECTYCKFNSWSRYCCNLDIFQFDGFVMNTQKITITPSDNCVNKDLHMWGVQKRTIIYYIYSHISLKSQCDSHLIIISLLITNKRIFCSLRRYLCVYIEDKNVIHQSLANLLGYIPVKYCDWQDQSIVGKLGIRGNWHKCLGKFCKEVQYNGNLDGTDTNE